jgi:putative ABC transport system permease protein
MKTLLSSFLLAFHNIRSHFFHTLLSVLGIVIGVAALVSILSLIDGMEDYAKEQITKTTSLTAITISTNPYTKINGVRVKKDSFDILRYEDYEQLKSSLTKPCALHYMTSFADEAIAGDGQKKIAAVFFALGSNDIHSSAKFLIGNEFTQDQVSSREPVALVNLKFVSTLDSLLKPEQVIGKSIILRGRMLTIQSVFDDGGDQPRVGFPLTLMTAQELRDDMPNIVVEASSVEDVTGLVSQINTWLNNRFPNGSFNVWTNSARVEQAAKGFLLFRVIMGLIVGISVVVGGIGIMNVLLISITERTAEIGIRKAVGANRRHLILQFLAESVTVSVFGSIMGLILGVLGTMAVVPIVAAITKVPFYANYTLNTLVIVSVLAVLLGIIFGTYPAIRASRLDPVEAIRHE